MKDYLIVYTGSWGMPPDEDGQVAVKAAWGEWFQKVGDAVRGGEPLGPGRTITPQGESTMAGLSPEPSGFMILGADSMDDCLRLMDGHPHVRFGGSVTIYETMKM